MLITNFSSGELSPYLSGRSDLAQYYSGASRVENFTIIPTGGIKRRCGTKRLGSLHSECRLIPFVLDKDNVFIFEIVPSRIYIWKNGAKLLDNSGNQIYLTVPYSSLAQIKEIQYAQNYDTMVLAQKDYAPYMIAYDIAYTTFTAAAMTFNFSPTVELDDDYDAVLICTDATLPAPGVGTYLYAILNGTLYHRETITSTWQVVGESPDIDTDLFTTASNYPGCVAFFNNRLWFAATYNAGQKIWASAAPDTKNTRYNVFPTYTKYVTVNKVVKEEDLHIFTATVTKDSLTLTGVTQDLSSIADITKYYVTSDYTSIGTKCASFSWDITTEKGTLTMDTAAIDSGDAKVFTVQLWRYSTQVTEDDYEIDVVSKNQTTSDNSFFFEVASDQNDSIKWLATNKQLIAGTESSEWVIPSTVTALDVSAVLNTRYGSDDIQATSVANAVIFFGQGKQTIREYYWNSDDDAFRSNNLAMTAEQMFSESPAVDFDFETAPYARLIAVRSDGTAVIMLYEKSSQVMGWYRFTCEGTLLSCATARGDAGSDAVYFAAKHGTEYYLECFDEAAAVYLDSFSEYTGSVSGYGSTAVLYNYTTHKQCPATAIPADFISTGDSVYIGYLYTSTMQSMPVLKSDPTGLKRIASLLVRFYESYLPVMKNSETNTEESFTGITEPFTGVKQITYPGSSAVDVTFTLETQKPERCTVLAVNAKLAN